MKIFFLLLYKQNMYQKKRQKILLEQLTFILFRVKYLTYFVLKIQNKSLHLHQNIDRYGYTKF